MDEFKIRSESQIIEIPITLDMLNEAKIRADQMGCLNSHSMMKGERNIEGVLGELAALSFLRDAFSTNNYDNDLGIGEITIDVKTKRLSNKPKMYFDCTVYGYNPNQNCDIYLFCGVKSDYSVVWLKGFISKEDFYKKAEFCRAGSQRPLGNGQMLTYKKDNYVIKVEELCAVNFLNGQ